jgi:hypothetical protein
MDMAEYLFDGKKLKKRSGQKEGEIEGVSVRKWNGEKVGMIDGTSLKDPQGKVVLNFDGKGAKDGEGKKLASIEEIKKIIEGGSGIELVAVWYFFVWM